MGPHNDCFFLPSAVYSTYILVEAGNRVFNSQISVGNIALHHSSLSVYPIVLDDIALGCNDVRLISILITKVYHSNIADLPMLFHFN